MSSENIEDLFEKFKTMSENNNISPDMVNNLFNMINNSNNTSSSNNYDTTSTSSNTSSDFQNNGFNNIDFETIMKMKNIIDNMNIKDDPRSNLLQSLKPYLNESRKSKVDQYIQLMNMSKVMEIFPFMGGEKRN